MNEELPEELIDMCLVADVERVMNRIKEARLEWEKRNNKPIFSQEFLELLLDNYLNNFTGQALTRREQQHEDDGYYENFVND